jgi:hypothetical protein
MKSRILLVALFILILPLAAIAETTIKAEVEKSKITTDEVLTYKVIVASTESGFAAPVFPKFTGFAVISQAQSSTVSFMRGGVKTILVYAFILAPTTTGKLKIDPASVNVKGQAISSESINIEVIQGKRKPQPLPTPQKKKPSLPQQVPGSPQEPQYTL